MILSDNETKLDLINHDQIVKSISNIIETHDEPLTIGIHGDWGAGKSSILLMLEDLYDEKDNYICIKFNSWRYQDFEDSKIALIEEIINGLESTIDDQQGKISKLKELLSKINYKQIAKTGGNIGFNILTGLPSPDQTIGVISKLKELFQSSEDNSLSLNKEEIENIVQNEETITKNVREFRKLFKELIGSVDISNILVFVDDLDRCLPKTVIGTLEAMRLFLLTDKMIFILASDEAMIEYSVKVHFPKLPNSSGHLSYSQNYLEKLIQIPFRIPSLGIIEAKAYISLLLIKRVTGSTKIFEDIVEVFKKAISKPWINTKIDYNYLNEELGKRIPEIKPVLSLSKNISNSLAEGTNGNPRQIKRFLNTLFLREQMAELRGFGDEIEISILAKIMLAERFFRDIYTFLSKDLITSSDGISTPIKIIEENARDNSLDIQISNIQTELLANNYEKNWITSRNFSWYNIEPNLGEVDLRPYLFATRDGNDLINRRELPFLIKNLYEKIKDINDFNEIEKNELDSLSENQLSYLTTLILEDLESLNSLKERPKIFNGIIFLANYNTKTQEIVLNTFMTIGLDELDMWFLQDLRNINVFDENTTLFDELEMRIIEYDNNPKISKALQFGREMRGDQ